MEKNKCSCSEEKDIRAKKCSKCYLSTMRGKSNPMYGRRRELSPHWKGRITRCIDCNNEVDYRNKRCKWCEGKRRSRLIKNDRNPNWRGGLSKEPYPFNFDEELKELVRKRDNYRCQLCGVPQRECFKKLFVHHIDYNKSNLNPLNLVSLCNKCHSKTNGKRSQWEKEFIQNGGNKDTS
ncbi:hypothetical protein LCGC14_2143330 [marine sediment metagenome]|uniref:HNH nuclease domain-containing protein n=1 Tax=marine sediment metagenome TaxID=412755 RepID=A0A0F9GAQ8_9ZZZZ